MLVIIVAFFLINAIILRANMDPIVREVADSENILRFGSTSPPLITPDFLEKIKEEYIPGQAILSTPGTQTALYAFLDIDPQCPFYNAQLYDNSKWGYAFLSLYYRSGYTPGEWLTHNNGTLVVLGYADVNGGPSAYMNMPIEIEKLDIDGNLNLIYIDEQNGQRIYHLNIDSS